MTRYAVSVKGLVPVGELGHVQMHEHLHCDLSATRRLMGGAEDSRPIVLENLHEVRTGGVNLNDALLTDVGLAIEELARYRDAGGATIVDATTVGLGRSPDALVRIAEATGVNVVMGAGYYVHHHHPPEVERRSREDIRREIVGDLMSGDPVTGVRAGVIGEIGLTWPLIADETKVLEAAAEAQLETGAALIIHPGRAREAPLAHVRVVRRAGGDIERTVMSHVDRTLFSLDDMTALADTGCILEFDFFGRESSYYRLDPSVDLPNDGLRVRYIAHLVERGYGSQVLIAQDTCLRTQLVRYGGPGYAHILEWVLPLMQARGISARDVDEMTRGLPARLLGFVQTD